MGEATVTKTTTAERYDIRLTDEMGWAIIIIDERSGVLCVVSDFGEYGYCWSSIGERTLKEFLCNLDNSYLLGKLCGSQDIIDSEATINNIKRDLIEKRRERELAKDVVRKSYELVKDLQSTSEEEIFNVISLDETLGEMYDWGSCAPLHYMHPYQAQAFVDKIWPHFIETLKLEQEGKENGGC